jgi:heme/copper-type cytochrome/quinol oxidase subunit 2
MFWSILRHRRSKGHPPAQFSGSTRLEIAWTAVPVLILVGMAWPAARTVIAMKDTSRPDLTIQVTGHQRKWEYAYLGEGVRFFSSLATPREQIYAGRPRGANYLLEVDRPLVVPAGRKVRLVLTSADVIHAWWVPEFGVKQDAIPGFIRDSWFEVRRPGIYRGQCAELCGAATATCRWSSRRCRPSASPPGSPRKKRGSPRQVRRQRWATRSQNWSAAASRSTSPTASPVMVRTARVCPERFPR